MMPMSKLCSHQTDHCWPQTSHSLNHLTLVPWLFSPVAWHSCDWCDPHICSKYIAARAGTRVTCSLAVFTAAEEGQVTISSTMSLTLASGARCFNSCHCEMPRSDCFPEDDVRTEPEPECWMMLNDDECLSQNSLPFVSKQGCKTKWDADKSGCASWTGSITPSLKSKPHGFSFKSERQYTPIKHCDLSAYQYCQNHTTILHPNMGFRMTHRNRILFWKNVISMLCPSNAIHTVQRLFPLGSSGSACSGSGSWSQSRAEAATSSSSPLGNT